MMFRQLSIAAALAATAWQAVGSTQQVFTSRAIATGLQAPWQVTLGPDDHLWVTERTAGRVVRIDPVSGAIAPAVVIDESRPGTSWQEGLLGMALHPDLLKGAGRDYVYVVYTYDADPGPALLRKMKLRRYTYVAASGELVDPLDLLTKIPAHDDHGGGRLVFGPDQKLYLTRGDNGSNWLANYCNPNHAQDLPSASQIAVRDWAGYEGKILRINLDGSIPADNPTLNGVKSHVYSYGHRNPQGLAFAPDGQLYSSEHGQQTDDELNLIVAGQNYGWPFEAGYRDDKGYTYTPWAQSSPTPCASLKFDQFTVPASVPRFKETDWHTPFQPPLRSFFNVADNFDLKASGPATIAPGGIAVYSARNGIPGWATSILLPGMTMGRVYRIKLSEDGKSAVGPSEELFRAANRYRDIAIGKDQKTFYLATDPAGLGRTTDPAGRPTQTYANPGAIVEFTYTK